MNIMLIFWGKGIILPQFEPICLVSCTFHVSSQCSHRQRVRVIKKAAPPKRCRPLLMGLHSDRAVLSPA